MFFEQLSRRTARGLLACRFGLTGAAWALAALLAGRAEAVSPSTPLKAVEESFLFASPDGDRLEERVTLSRDVAPALLRVPLEGKLRVAEWPVSPGVRRAVTLARHHVYAAGARIVKIAAEGEVEVPRSRWVFFWGGDDQGSTPVVVAVDPQTGSLRGITISEAWVHELTPPSSLAYRQDRLPP